MLRKTGVYILIAVLIWVGAINAKQAREILIEGDTISCDLAVGNVNASGNVKLNYRGYDIYSESIFYSVPEDTLWFPKRFQMQKASQNIVANDLEYHFDTSQGEAITLDAKISRLNIKGDKIVFMPDKIIIHGAKFTTCDQDDQHYWVKSNKMFLYPQWGFFVSWDNVFHTSFLPLDPWVPTYIYGSRTYSLVGSSTPIPEIGANKREGGYAKQRYGYFFNEKSTGTLDFGYTQNLGFFVGFNHGFGLNEISNLNLRAHYLERDDFEGAVEYRLDIAKRNQRSHDTEDVIGGFFKKFTPEELPSSRLTLLMQHREILLDSRVSYLPKVQFEVNEYNILDLGVYFNAMTSIGRVQEETFENEFNKAGERSLSGGLRKNFELSKDWYLETRAFFIGDWYDSGERWRRSFFATTLGWECPILQPRLSYTKKLSNNGATPFEFKRMYALRNDEIGLELTQEFGWTELALDADYEIEDKKFRNFDLIASVRFHCWRLVVRWLMQQRQFTLGVDIY
jgi:hypothetical protein